MITLSENNMSYTGTYKIAEHVFLLKTLYEYSHELCTLYETEEIPYFTIEISEKDILFESEKSRNEAIFEGIEPIEYEPSYLESLAVLRKLANIMLKNSFILFHGSSLALDGEGYIFTAKSGTGKSTHTRFWQKSFKDRCVMINDDKPILKVEDDKVTVFGSPWNGKHNIGNNISAPLKVISILNRGENNTAEVIDKKTAFGMLLQQTYRPDGVENMAMLLPLIDKLADNVKLFNIHCNLEESAAVEIHNAIGG